MKAANHIFPFSLLVSALFLSACSESGIDDTHSVEAQLVEDLPGNINTIVENRAPVEDVNDHPNEEGTYTFFDLESGETISDSSSAEWDIAFDGTTILANSGNGGGILVTDSRYDSLITAPASGYNAQTEGMSWYTYTGMAPSGPQHAVLPNEDKTIVVLTPDSQYAKVQILSYYKGNPDTSSEEFADLSTRPPGGYFTFNYLLQSESGNTSLKSVERITYFDLESGEVVEDSTSSQWDIAFSGTTIYANTVNEGGIQSLNIPFEYVDEAPISGYEASVSDWYIYTGQAASGPQHAVLVNEDVSLIAKTPDNSYAKIRILSYYKGNPDVSSDAFINAETRPESRYFTFEYAIQKDGTTVFN